MVASVSALSSAGQAASYYEADDYYAEGGLAPSEWFGEAAQALGLSGEVDREQFAALLEGQVAELKASTSWRITRPLRKVKDGLKLLRRS